jgi:hypothetical protein
VCASRGYARMHTSGITHDILNHVFSFVALANCVRVCKSEVEKKQRIQLID